MYTKCCVPGCISTRKDAKLHRFPRDEKRLQSWLKFIKCDVLRNKSAEDLENLQVCHKHFEKRFVTQKSRLLGNAYPTLFLKSEILSGTPSTPLKEHEATRNRVETTNLEHSYAFKKHTDHNYCMQLEESQTESNYELLGREITDVSDNDEVTPSLDRVSEKQEPKLKPNSIPVTSNMILTNQGTAPEPLPESGSPEELLEIPKVEDFGIEQTTDKKYGKEIQKDLAILLQHWATVGLTQKQREELNERYLTPENSKLIDPPILNAEIKGAVSHAVAECDKAIENKQANMSSTIGCLAEGITLLLSTNETINTTLLQLLTDAVRMCCDSIHADSVTRRNYIISSVKTELGAQLRNTEIDKFLFGENLSKTLKLAKAVDKSETDVRPAISKKFQNKEL